MPWFRCLIRGENFITADEEAMGFYATRWINAKDASAAEVACLKRLKKSNDLRESFPPEKSKLAKVYFEEIEEIEESSERFGGGYVFFNMSEADENGAHEDARSIEVEANT